MAEPESPPTPTPSATTILHLPTAVIGTIMTKLDVASLCSVASTCRSLRSCASSFFSFTTDFHFLEIAPTLEILWPLLPPNPHLHSLKLDCSRLNDSSIGCLLRPTLNELCLLNCQGFSGRLLTAIGNVCPDLRSLSLSFLAEQRGLKLSLLFNNLEQLLNGCSHIESLNLAFDLSTFLHPKYGQLWTTASKKLSSLKIGYISMEMFLDMLNAIWQPECTYHINPPIFANLQKLCLSVDNITDTLVTSMSRTLVSLTHLDLKDAPLMEPVVTRDLSNAGLQQINMHRKLKHLSLVRSQEFLYTYFRRVNDLGMMLMADTCSSLESICLGGFCRVTDAGFRAILHSCSNLQKLKVSCGSQMTDLMFHDMCATSLSLLHISLRRCNLLTNLAISRLSFNTNIRTLDLRDCRNMGDEALRSVGFLKKLEVLLLDGTEISDLGISYLGDMLGFLCSLSVRGCRRLTDNCIPYIFSGSLKENLHFLDFSRVPNLSDNGILLLAKSGVSLIELRMRDCPLIGDKSVMALASMQIGGVWHGSSLQLLDLYECRGITQLSFRWFKKLYFPRLRWLGVTGSSNRDLVDALARTRPFLHISCHGEELGTSYWDAAASWYGPEDDEVDELEEWLLEGDYTSDEEDMDAAEA